MKALKRSPFVALVVALDLSGAVAARAQTPSGGFLSVNFGVDQPSPSTFTSTYKESTPSRSGTSIATAQFQADYPAKTGPAFDIGGGAFVGSRYAISFAVSRHADQQRSNVAFIFTNPNLTSRAQSDPIERVETALHVQLAYAVPIASAVKFLVFAGPTYITARQEFVSDLNVTNAVVNPRTGELLAFSICCLQTEHEKASAWGYNVGADFSYWVTKAVGVGALVRFSRGTVDLTNPVASSAQSRLVTEPVDVGGLAIAAGLRLRLGARM